MKTHTEHRAIAIVGLGAILPDAPDVTAFWSNLCEGRYSIREVDPQRWDPALFWDSDPSAPDKCYSKIGGWVSDWEWNPLGWRLPIPPKVADAMDEAQRWAIACTRMALDDAKGALDRERTAVILGNAMGGEKHYRTTLRAHVPELLQALEQSPSFQALDAASRESVLGQLADNVREKLPPITEDTMPGELSNCVAGRIANLFDFQGPNFVVDAACASAMAAMSASIEGLLEHEFDAVLTGGIDRNMGVASFIKFCKIGALSATGTRPYGDGADGFVMGEGSVIFLLKRLADAERDGDRIHAVIRGIGGSSDGRGKGITAPNPRGQELAIERGWSAAGLSPASASYVEGHGTSTKVGDVVELQSLSKIFGGAGAAKNDIAIGSVKSNIGHLKSAAGAAGVLKAVLALREKTLPPSLNADAPNPNFDFADSPFRVNTELRAWPEPDSGVRRAGVSAFGFGGTNFHVVLEEYVPGRIDTRQPSAGAAFVAPPIETPQVQAAPPTPRGVAFIGASDARGLAEALDDLGRRAERGETPPALAPTAEALRAPERLAIDFGDAAELSKRVERTRAALERNDGRLWSMLASQGVFRGRGAAPKTAFLYTGQGSQYVNMLADLAQSEPIVRETFAEADAYLAPLLGERLSKLIFVDPSDEGALKKARQGLMQTAITQPAVLTVDIALTRLLAAQGHEPDMVMGHSLGEYGALVASGALGFREALEAVSARGREMTRVSMEDNGKMAAVFAPIGIIEATIAQVEGYAVIANINSSNQAVVGGASDAVERVANALSERGFKSILLPVSHAFHTSIVAPASEPLMKMLERLEIRGPQIPCVSNVTGNFYPTGISSKDVIELLGRQIASPVQFVKGLETLYAEGARVFVELGPKTALKGFVDDVLGAREDVRSLFTNHPKVGDAASVNQALCGLWAAGCGVPEPREKESMSVHSETARSVDEKDLEALFNEFLERSRTLFSKGGPAAPKPGSADQSCERVVISGASLGLPGRKKVFEDDNVEALLRGDQFITRIEGRQREAMASKHVTRLVKRETGEPSFEVIDDPADVLKLAGQPGELDIVEEFGVAPERDEALDTATRLAMGAGILALHDAGLPLVRHYKKTTKGTYLPEGWRLPDTMRDDTGIIFASAFPGYDSFAKDLTAHHAELSLRARIDTLKDLHQRISAQGNGAAGPLAELEKDIVGLEEQLAREPYAFDRRFLFRALSMGHSQLAEEIGARGPNTQINSACASTTQALALAEDWIAAGRCRRVLIVASDNVTSDTLLEWIGAGFLATGAAATDERVEDAALPFDRRRHGMLMGMGAAAMVVEHEDAARERGVRPICELLASVTANSAFHGTRLDVHHISEIMEKVVSEAESRWGIERSEIAKETVFISHETYTPARGGSAAAEVEALRAVFGDQADHIVVANTKGFTGHPMGVGIEDAMAVKILETGIVPPVPNFKEVDETLGTLNLSSGGPQSVSYALRLAAGFGSQVSMALFRWHPSPDGVRRAPSELGYETRIESPKLFQEWLSAACRYPEPALETVQHRLRVIDQGPPALLEIAEEKAAVVEESAPAPEVEPPIEISEDAIREQILAIVADTTGYPADMLDPELDLEADLGIDTVKQAEIFAAVRAAFGIERDENLQLKDFPTLEHVVRFAVERGGSVEAAAPAAEPEPAPAPLPEPGPAPEPALGEDAIREQILAIVADTTGYPADMLDPELDLEADLGIDTVKQAEIFAAVRAAFGIERDENLQLKDFPTLEHVVRFAVERGGCVEAAAPAAEPEPAPAPLPETGPAPEPALGEDAIREQILAIVADTTGYPADMLDPELDLEADLGIDTVKQAEIFAAVRAAFGIERDENLQLKDFPTLEHVVRFAVERGSGKSPDPEDSPPSPRPSKKPVPAPEMISPAVDPKTEALGNRLASAIPRGSMEASREVPRRVPELAWRPATRLCKSTGVKLDASSRVVIVGDPGGVGQCLSDALAMRGVEVLLVPDAPPADELRARLQGFREAGAVQGLYWLPALAPHPELSGLDASAFREEARIRVKLLHATLRVLAADISGAGNFVVAATRMGGTHGYDVDGAVHPLGGAVSGYVKAYAREKPETLCKVIDFEPTLVPEGPAQRLIEETLRDPGAVEIGSRSGERWSVGLVEIDHPSEGAGILLDERSVFIVTGAAGGIVSSIVADLASSLPATFHLLDLAPAPDGSDPELALYDEDPAALKRRIFERLKADGRKATPVAVERELSRLERARCALAAMAAVRNAGGQAHWHSVDLRDGEAVREIVRGIAEQHGRVSAFLHAAGLEISRPVEDKSQDEFDLVFDVKAEGWHHVMSALADTPLDAAVVFSSVAGRFGNSGQVDYSAANDFLCKSVSHLAQAESRTRGLALDWTAWAGLGMATRGSIPTIMKHAGIDMLAPEKGLPVVRRELELGLPDREIVVGEELGILVAPIDASGGIDPQTLTSRLPGPMVNGRVELSLEKGLVVTSTLDPAKQPFLHDHAIDGVPVLPGVMGIEAFAELADLLFVDWRIVNISDVNFEAPFKFYRGMPREVRLEARVHPDNGSLHVDCSLIGVRTIVGRPEPQITRHFSARVVLGREGLEAPAEEAPSPHSERWISSEDVYRVYFHGPAYKVLNKAWSPDSQSAVGEMAERLPRDVHPGGSSLVMSPRHIELCFQTAGMLDLGREGRMRLPHSVGRVLKFRDPALSEGPLYTVVRQKDGGAAYDAQVVDGRGSVFMRVEDYRTIPLPSEAPEDKLAPIRSAMSPED